MKEDKRFFNTFTRTMKFLLKLFNNKFKLKTKNLHWGGFTIATFIIVAAFVLSFYHQVKINNASSRNISSLKSIEIINELQVTYYSQLLAWKNLLLEGHIDDEYNRQIGEFNTISESFKTLLGNLADNLNNENRLGIKIKKDIESIVQAHMDFERNCYNSLETFSLKTSGAYQNINALSFGHDVEISLILKNIKKKLFEQIQYERDKTLAELKNMDYFLGSGLALSILIFMYTSRLQSKIIQNNDLFQMIAEHSKDGVMVLEKGIVTYLSPTYSTILEQEKVGMSLEQIIDFIHKDDKPHFLKRYKEATLSHQKYIISTHRALHVKGFYRYKEDRISYEYNHLNEVERIYIFSRDVTHDVEKEHQIRESEEKYRTFVRLSSDMIFLKDEDFKYIIVNQNLANYFGKNPDEIIGKNDFELMRYEIAQTCRISDLKAYNASASVTTQEQVHGQTYETTKYTLIFQGKKCLAGVIRDITEHVQHRDKIHHLAFYDSLTALPNRKLFMDRLEHAFIIFKKNRIFGGVVLMDIDNFKIINDTWGHEKGDLLLIEIAKRIKAKVDSGVTISRFGGDEFVVLFEELSNNQVEAARIIASIAEDIKISLQNPYEFGENEYLCTVSVGVSVFDTSHDESSLFVKEAEIALYKAKEEGRNSIRFFEASMQERLSMKYFLETALRSAIKTNGFELYYQPQVDSKMRIVGAEALLRWNHNGNIVPPGDFIPMLEETGLITQVGDWILSEGMEVLQRWSKDSQRKNWSLALNVSPKQFENDNFINGLQNTMANRDSDCARLKLEITEGLFLKKTQSSIEKIKTLRNMGIGISLDDFGTGYSSLSYLKRIPITQIKIDQSFVRDIFDDSSDAQIIEMIIAVAKNMNVSLVAEGVENFEQFQWLSTHGCEYFQGFYIDKPQKLEMFERKWSQFSV